MVGWERTATEAEGLDGVEGCRGEDATLYNIELGAAAGLGGVDVVAHACSGEGATSVEELGSDLGGEGIGRVGPAKAFGASGPGAWVTRLDHEALNDAVEEDALVEVAADELDEVVPVKGCGVGETEAYISLGGSEEDIACPVARAEAAGGLCLQDEREAEQSEEEDPGWDPVGSPRAGFSR